MDQKTPTDEISSQRRTRAPKKMRTQPLYQQVDNTIRRRLIDNFWKPGEAIPSEMQLAAEMNVSQGTVRKALNDLVAENLLYRRQGLGTFVSEHTERRALFLFFSIVGDEGARLLPESRVLDCAEDAATPMEAARLQLAPSEMVVRFRRVRFFDENATIVETITLPLKHFPGFGTEVDPPNNLFRFYQSAYGVSVAKTDEQLTAVSATEEEALLLGIDAGTPLLEIDRTAKMLDERPVEWRVSHCDTTKYRYVAERG